MQYAVLLLTLRQQLLQFRLGNEAARLERAIDKQPWRQQFWATYVHACAACVPAPVVNILGAPGQRICIESRAHRGSAWRSHLCRVLSTPFAGAGAVEHTQRPIRAGTPAVCVRTYIRLCSRLTTRFVCL